LGYSPRELLGPLLAVLLLAAGPYAFAFDLPERFKDQSDGMLDLSDWLLERRGFLPVPLIITEPAVGYGAGLALAFFREPLGESARRAQETGHVTPPNIFVVAGLATENGTKAAAAGGQFTFLDDRYRYRGGIGDVSVNLDFYGIGGRLPGDINKIGYNLKGLGSLQQGMMRLGESNVFAAARWVYLDLDARLQASNEDAGLAERQTAKRSSGLGAALEHDSRDNIFTPNRGWLGVLEATFYDESIGSTNNFQIYRGYAFHYSPLSPQLILGLRADVKHANGDVPFYMLPYIGMRGIPAARFQDNNVAVLEAEARYNLDARWALVGFLGTGRAWGRSISFGEAEKPVSGGAGFRYLIARRLGIYAGVDYAHSTVDNAIYITVGSAWR
jgi:hypothetical protein